MTLSLSLQIWPLITAYLMCAVAWLVMWPFMKLMPSCGRHKYAGPIFKVLGVAVWSPIKVVRFVWHTYHKGEPDATDIQNAVQVANELAPSTTPAPQVMTKA